MKSPLVSSKGVGGVKWVLGPVWLASLLYLVSPRPDRWLSGYGCLPPSSGTWVDDSSTHVVEERPYSWKLSFNPHTSVVHEHMHKQEVNTYTHICFLKTVDSAQGITPEVDLWSHLCLYAHTRAHRKYLITSWDSLLDCTIFYNKQDLRIYDFEQY